MFAKHYEIRDPRFEALAHPYAGIDHLWTGGRFTEGPVYVPAGRYLLFSDMPNDRVLRWDETSGAVSVFQTPCGVQNSHTLDHQGRVLACEHGGRVVSRTEANGSRAVLAATVGGKRLNSPNDVVVKSDGSIWFTDPTYGIDTDYEGDIAARELDGCHVYRLAPDGELSAVVTDMVRPNGLAFSPDERILYVADTGRTHRKDCAPAIRAYPVDADGLSLGPGREFAVSDAGLFDGFRVDTAGNIWTSAGDGVHCFAPDGTLLGKILIPEVVANVAFGGPKRNRLFICATTSLYAIYVNARGIGI